MLEVCRPLEANGTSTPALVLCFKGPISVYLFNGFRHEYMLEIEMLKSEVQRVQNEVRFMLKIHLTFEFISLMRAKATFSQYLASLIFLHAAMRASFYCTTCSMPLKRAQLEIGLRVGRSSLDRSTTWGSTDLKDARRKR